MFAVFNSPGEPLQIGCLLRTLGVLREEDRLSVLILVISLGLEILSENI